MKFIAENKKRKIAVKKGYSLVEVLVSLIILSLGLLGVVYLMNSNTKSSLNSRNEIIASELAQEGIELVYNINSNATATVLFDGSYSVDYASNVLGLSGNAKLNLNSSGFFTSSSGTQTKFLRKIDISGSNGSGNPVTVTSTVSWWSDSSGPAFPPTCTTAYQCVSVTSEIISK